MHDINTNFSRKKYYQYSRKNNANANYRGRKCVKTLTSDDIYRKISVKA